MSPRTAGTGSLEMQVLGLVAERAEPASVTEIQAELRRRGHELAYTTVMTVLSRLHAKGQVARRREGRQYLYAAASARTERTRARILATVAGSLFQGGKFRPLLALLKDDDGISESELRELRAEVDRRLKALGPKA